MNRSKYVLVRTKDFKVEVNVEQCQLYDASASCPSVIIRPLASAEH